MGERRETSVTTSLQEILQDATSREEQERAEAARRAREEEQRRVDDAKRKQEAETARLKAEEEDRDRRAFEEKRRAAELVAVQEATLQRAKLEAESQARLAEMTARQEHERHLHSLSQDKHKKRLTGLLIGVGVLAVAGAVGAGIVIKRSMDATAAGEARVRELQQEIEQNQHQQDQLKNQLASATDPKEIEALKQQIEDAKAAAAAIKAGQSAPKPVYHAPAGGGGGGGGSKPADKPKSNCAPGDPLCAGI